MRKLLIPLLLAVSLSALAAGERVTAQTIELKDGGKVFVKKDGTMVHIDAAGNRVKMRNGVTMEAKDGAKYVMKNDALWKTITEKGTLNPKF
ncbi:CopK family periplasmic copper-binding protein [Zoogloea sp.]|uniref:CopK family periplasmic copper-binding protein n=1 Tax=Zoogloea sp. TaxID=49181 RepID=UPI001A3B0ECC|nr:CopK family periplasmic copper-binding protein [Zoogloea sp.]MBS0349348.1 CopK family periplasmic copper-binding protein [Pseudomonadota bacterium]MBS0370611.1 CopK family periplasmic copper-binding protein [Pseudomonadota bacterium]HNI20974.1 CopK family periplasmic copper-binding protein [Nitrospira sp.]